MINDSKIRLLLLALFFIHIITRTEAKDFLFNCNNGSCVIKNAEIKAIDPEQLDFSFYTDATWYTTAKTIEFKESKLHTIPTNIITKMPNLERIEASNCQIHQIEINIFGEGNTGNLKKLEYLSLANNKIFELQNDLFIGAKNLGELLLGWNEIEFVSEAAFNGLTNLKLLFLGHNLIKTLPPKTFNPLTSLNKVILSHNQLDAFDIAMFKANNNSENLSLNDNKIVKFVLSVPTTFKYLQLSGNQLDSFEYENIKVKLPNFVHLSIYKNNWNCSYLIRMVEKLYDQDIKTNALHYDGAKDIEETNVKGIGCYFEKVCECENLNTTNSTEPLLANLEMVDNSTASVEAVSNNAKFQTALETINEDIKNLTSSLIHIESKMNSNVEKIVVLESYVKQQDALLLNTIVMVGDKVDLVLERLKQLNFTISAGAGTGKGVERERERVKEREKVRRPSVFDQPRSWNRDTIN